VRLKNSSEVAKPLVEATMIALRTLAEKDPITFYEFVELCRNPGHELWDAAIGETLKRLSLVLPNGSVRDSIQNIVLSAVSGSGDSLAISNPIAV
jgi:hypothetical protein